MKVMDQPYSVPPWHLDLHPLLSVFWILFSPKDFTMPKLKPWYQVIIPREDLRQNRPLDASELAIHLDRIRFFRAHADYT